MTDVTQILNRYRECVRNLWNVFFWIQLNPDWDIRDKYEDICVKLFSTLVLDQVSRNDYLKSPPYSKSREPLLFFRVIPSASGGVPININREKNTSPYWDHPIKIIKPGEMDLRFVDYFDFDVLQFREYRYCLVKIVASKINTDLVGRDALIECDHISIQFDETV